MSDFREYDGDPAHDMWVDYSYGEYTGGGGYSSAHPLSVPYTRNNTIPESLTEKITARRRRILDYDWEIVNIEADIDHCKEIIQCPTMLRTQKTPYKRLLPTLPGRIEVLEAKRKELELNLIELLKEEECSRLKETITLCVVALAVLLPLIFWFSIY